MATLTIHSKRVIENIRKLNNYLEENNIKWTLITKMLNGYKPILEKLLFDGELQRLHSVGDARISNLKAIKEIAPDIVTMYIKPPAFNQVKNVIKYADISLNSNIQTLEKLDLEAGKAGKIHRVVVMIEMGELREGILRENIIKFYSRAFDLKNINIIGLGTNLGCMYGVEPTYDKLIQLSLYKQLIESMFGKKMELVSGGSSITLPLISRKKVPKEVNHFRIGETVFLGVSPLNNKRFKNLSTTAFDFSGEILEFEKKGNVPDGNIGEAAIGQTAGFDNENYHESWRCIVDFGEIDVDVNNLTLKDKKLNFVGTTSDMTVFDMEEESKNYRVGDKIHFQPNYMAIARLTNSKYMTKIVH